MRWIKRKQREDTEDSVPSPPPDAPDSSEDVTDWKKLALGENESELGSQVSPYVLEETTVLEETAQDPEEATGDGEDSTRDTSPENMHATPSESVSAHETSEPGTRESEPGTMNLGNLGQESDAPGSRPIPGVSTMEDEALNPVEATGDLGVAKTREDSPVGYGVCETPRPDREQAETKPSDDPEKTTAVSKEIGLEGNSEGELDAGSGTGFATEPGGGFADNPSDPSESTEATTFQSALTTQSVLAATQTAAEKLAEKARQQAEKEQERQEKIRLKNEKKAAKAQAKAAALAAAKARNQLRLETGHVPAAGQVKVQVARVSPLSAAKIGFLVTVAFTIVQLVAAGTLWVVLDMLHVFSSMQGFLQALSATALVNLMDTLQFSRFIAIVALNGVLQILLLTLLSWFAAVIYNLIARMVGGLHIVLTDD